MISLDQRNVLERLLNMASISFITETNCSKWFVLCPDPLRNPLSALCALISVGFDPNSWHLLISSVNYLWLEPLCLHVRRCGV